MCKISALKNKFKLAAVLCLLVATCCKAYAQKKGFVAIPHYDTASNYFSVSVNGIQLPAAKYKDVHYASFQQEKAVTITIRCNEEIQDFKISPLSKKIVGKKVTKNAIQFELLRSSYLVVKVNNKERLFLFSEKPLQPVAAKTISVLKYKVDNKGQLTTASIQQAIDETASRHQTLHFPAGIYKTGKLEIPSNARIVFSPGALLKASDNLNDFKSDKGSRAKGFLNFINAENVVITGYGAIDGNGRRLRDKYGDSARMRLLFFNNAKNISIGDIVQRDPGSWNTQILNSEHIDFHHVKLMNDAALANTDGFDPDASSFVTIENCFAYCGDDNVAIKITQPVNTSVTSDIKVKACVFLTRKSSLKVGTESRGATIKNILFQDNDVLLSDRGMALYCSDGAVYENIRYLDNRFEENYPDAKRMGIHFTINKRNKDSKEGVMKNVQVENCTFYQSFPNKSQVEGLDEAHKIEVKVKHLLINGKSCISEEEAELKTSFANIVIQ